MTSFSTVALSDGTVGQVRGLPEVGDKIVISLHDENELPVTRTGVVAEVLVEAENATPNHPNRATLYTVLSNTGDVIGRHLTVAQAADEILTDDGREWRIDGLPVDLRVIEDEDDLEETRDGWCVDQRAELAVGCKAGRFHAPGCGTGYMTVWSNDRAAVATNGDSVWGIWDSERNLFTPDNDPYGSFNPEKGYVLIVRQQVANRPWSRTVVMSYAENLEQAEAKIMREVIRADWPRHPYAITDVSYDEMMAELAAEETA
ncbi:MAG: hypothetical protein ACP5QR_05165 [Rhizomicrobium sp.]